MTDYNKRLDKILKSLAHKAYLTAHAPGHTKLDGRTYRAAVDKAKQAFTSLIKELVAGAKPKTTPFDNNLDDGYATDIRSNAINEFEQNLLKELEEK